MPDGVTTVGLTTLIAEDWVATPGVEGVLILEVAAAAAASAAIPLI